jgi:OmpA-OmpF porin, OOP family
VVLRGSQPAAGDGDKAIEVAKAAACPSWAGELTCAIDVRGEFDAPAAKPATPAAPAAAGPLALPDYKFVLAEGVLTLTGEVPDEASHKAAVDAANALIAAPKITRVDDKLTIRGDKSVTEGYRPILARGTETLASCKHGHSEFVKGKFSLNCEVAAADEAPLRTRAGAALPPGEIGTINLVVAEAADRCDKDFADLLSKSKVEFDTSSATIKASSQPLLKSLADVAARCNGKLAIEGHTDSRGDLPNNMKLSDARAGAVRTALAGLGIANDRLTAQGFGPNKPIGDNQSDDGRARNRRIEVHMIRE